MMENLCTGALKSDVNMYLLCKIVLSYSTTHMHRILRYEDNRQGPGIPITQLY